MNIHSLINLSVLMNGIIIVILIYVIRAAYLKYGSRTDLIPELFIAPRGLISILLFFSIPETMKLSDTEDGLLLFVILATSMIMTYGLVRSRKQGKEEEEEIKIPTPINDVVSGDSK